tara:strand:- start:1919 stop:2080 length:162 start_codon:yes stop_codon:yes gene_type:complete
MLDKLNGKKTYIVCSLSVVWAIVGFALGLLEIEAAQQFVVTALVGAGLRHGIE